MVGDGKNVLGQVTICKTREAARMRGQHGSGDHADLNARCGYDGQRHCQRAFPKARDIMYGGNPFLHSLKLLKMIFHYILIDYYAQAKIRQKTPQRYMVFPLEYLKGYLNHDCMSNFYCENEKGGQTTHPTFNISLF